MNTANSTVKNLTQRMSAERFTALTESELTRPYAHGGPEITSLADRTRAAIRWAIVGLMLAAIGAKANAQVVSVGDDEACDYVSLQAAVNSIRDGDALTIRVSSASSGFVAEPVQIRDRIINLWGGFSSCSDTTSDANDHSIVRGGSATESVIDISSGSPGRTGRISLESLRIENGRADFGGGLRVSGDNVVRLSNTRIIDNLAYELGGGVHIEGSRGATLAIEYDSRIISNVADVYGGGIYCKNAAIDFRDGQIDDNRAFAHGGGLFLEGCSLNGDFPGSRTISRNRVDTSADPYSELIIDDEAQLTNASGGGLYAQSDSTIRLGGEDSTTEIAYNRVRSEIHDGFGFHYEENRGDGGGVKLIGPGTTAVFVNTHVAENQATTGAGAHVTRGAELTVQRSSRTCVEHPDYAGCASFANNLARGWDNGFTGCVDSDNNRPGQAGAIALRTGGKATLDGVRIYGNALTLTDGCVFSDYYREPEGGAFHVDTGGKLDLVNSLMYNNGGSPAHDVIHVRGFSSRFRSLHSTITDNSGSADATIQTGYARPRVELYSTILVESADRVLASLDAQDPRVVAHCLYTNRRGDLTSFDDAVVNELTEGNDPGFLSAGNRDYRLQPGGNAVDRCSEVPVTEASLANLAERDLSGNARPVINVLVDQPYDLGAYEEQSGTPVKVVDLGVTITDGGLPVPVNGTVGYEVRLRNEGPSSVSKAGFRLRLPPNLPLPYSVLPGGNGWDCIEDDYIVDCTYALFLSAGNEASPMFFQIGAPDSPDVAFASVQTILPAAFIDPVIANNAQSQLTTIGQSAELSVIATDRPAQLSPGNRAEFSFVLTNDGPDIAYAPKIKFYFPVDATDVRAESLAGTGWVCEDASVVENDTVMLPCERSQIGLGEVEFVVSGRAANRDPIGDELFTVVARVETSSVDDDVNNAAQASVPVVASVADVVITGTGPTEVKLGEPASYRLSVENAGPGVASGLLWRASFGGDAAEFVRITAAPGWSCNLIGVAAARTGMECFSGEDLAPNVPLIFDFDFSPVEASGDEWLMNTSVVSSTNDPTTGPGSNNELLLVAEVIEGSVDPDPLPDVDLVFESGFE